MTKNQLIVEKVCVTFVEAAVAYLAINQTNLSGNVKLTAIGALGAGLSAIYNLLRESNPTITQPAVVTPETTVSEVVTPAPEVPVEPPVQ